MARYMNLPAFLQSRNMHPSASHTLQVQCPTPSRVLWISLDSGSPRHETLWHFSDHKTCILLWIEIIWDVGCRMLLSHPDRLPGFTHQSKPVVPHKAVAEASEEETYRRVGCYESPMAERIHWWIDWWLELWFLKWLYWLQWSPHSQLLDVASCTAAEAAGAA